MSNPVEQLSNLFKQFPGIGARQAKRFAYFILKQDNHFIDTLVRELTNARQHVHQCAESYQFFTSDNPKETLSPLVRDESRTKERLMIVVKDLDLDNIESMHVYDGNYFVLGNLVPMIAENVERFVRIEPLLSLIKKRAENTHLKEIIIATPTNPEGEHTRSYVQEKIKPLVEEYGLSVTALGRGLSMGAELEYVDSETFQEAFNTRR